MIPEVAEGPDLVVVVADADVESLVERILARGVRAR